MIFLEILVFLRIFIKKRKIIEILIKKNYLKKNYKFSSKFELFIFFYYIFLFSSYYKKKRTSFWDPEF